MVMIFCANPPAPPPEFVVTLLLDTFPPPPPPPITETRYLPALGAVKVVDAVIHRVIAGKDAPPEN
jgi:hypothetical protein